MQPSRVVPMATVPEEEFICIFRPPGFSSVIGELTGLQRSPNILNGSDYVPGRFHHIRPLEQSSIAEHAIVQQPFIARLWRRVEIVSVVERHVDAPEPHYGSGNLRSEGQRYSFLRLKIQNQSIRLDLIDRSLAE